MNKKSIANNKSIPEVSVIIPTYNCAKYLSEAIIKLLRDEELRKKMGESGKKRVENCLQKSECWRKPLCYMRY